MNDRTCCICGDAPDCRHEVFTPRGQVTGVIYYFCEVHANDIEDWIEEEKQKVEDVREEEDTP